MGIASWTDRDRRMLTGAGLYAIASTIEAAAFVVMVPFVTRTVSVDVYARLALMLVASSVLLSIMDMGIGVALVRELAIDKQVDRRRVLIATAVWFRVAVCMVVAAAFVAASAAVAPPMSDTLVVGAWTIASWSLGQIVMEALRGQERHAAVAAAILIRCTLWSATLLWLVFLQGYGLVGLAAAWAAGHTGALLLALSRLGPRNLVERPDRKTLARLFRFGVPIGGYYLMRTAGALDRYLVSFRATLNDAALLQVASVPTGGIEIGERIAILSSEPYLYGLPESERARALDRFIRIVGFLITVGATSISMLAPEVLAVLAPKSYALALAAIPWLTFAAASRAVTRSVQIGAGMVGMSRLWAVAAAIELVLAAVAIFFVAPVWGVTGAGMVRFFAALVALLVGYALLRRVGNVDLPVARIVACSTLAVATASVLATGMVGSIAPFPVRAAAALVLIGIAYATLLRSLRRTASPAL